jgi:sirohydrochlorin ferrochelatase
MNLSRRTIVTRLLPAPFLLGSAITTSWAADNRKGILLLAHGTHRMEAMPAGDHAAHAGHMTGGAGIDSPSLWDANVEAIAQDLNKSHPTEVAFGMAETGAIQAAVDRLEARGVTTIVAVPLFISSHSPIIGNFRYILGLQQTLGAHTDLKRLPRVRSKAKFKFAEALDADFLVSEILYDRAMALTSEPAKANVVIIAHGPNDDEDNKLWLADMEKHAAYLKSRGFRSVEVLTHRNDADESTKDAARQAFRERVERASQDGLTVVVPLLLSEGGVEKEVEGDLSGLQYRFGKPLAPHPNLAAWVEAKFAALSEATP